jgi:serine/threonine-protein kinase
MTQGIPAGFSQRLLTSRLITAEQLAAARAVVGPNDRQLALHLVRTGLLTPFQARQLRAGASGFTVGRYVVVDRLGRGGNSIVFKARDLARPGHFVALKTLDAQNLHHGEDALARFRREIAIVRCLDHPNIVRALDVLETRTDVYLVLEFVPGCDLATLVRQSGPLPAADAVAYAVQAAQGLAYAHGRGVIHRDLKPGNLLRSPDGVIKLTDLGLARFTTRQPDADLTLKGVCLGTPEFMAPEQAEDANAVGPRSDLYGLGATLFHLLTAQLPVDGNTYMHRLKQLLTSPPRPLAAVRPDVPAGLAAVVDRLRARNPADRPASAEEAIALLKPFAARPADEDPERWSGRRKAALVLEVLQGRTTAAEACRRYGLAAEELEGWRKRFLKGAEQALDAAV